MRDFSYLWCAIIPSSRLRPAHQVILPATQRSSAVTARTSGRFCPLTSCVVRVINYCYTFVFAKLALHGIRVLMYYRQLQISSDFELSGVSAKLHYTDTGYGHVVYNTTNRQAHNKSTTCCTTNSPHRNVRVQNLDMSRCWDVAHFCPLVVSVGGVVQHVCSRSVHVEFGTYRPIFSSLQLNEHLRDRRTALTAYIIMS